MTRAQHTWSTPLITISSFLLALALAIGFPGSMIPSFARGAGGTTFTASYCGGDANVAKLNNIHSSTQDELEDAFREGLMDAGATAGQINDLDGEIESSAEAARGVNAQGKKAKAVTAPFFVDVPTGVKKFSITVLPSGFGNPLESTFTPEHEQTHQDHDKCAVDEVNTNIGSGDIPCEVSQNQLKVLLAAYEDAAAEEFHDVFGMSANEAFTRSVQNNTTVDDLLQDAGREGKISGTLALEAEIIRIFGP